MSSLYITTPHIFRPEQRVWIIFRGLFTEATYVQIKNNKVIVQLDSGEFSDIEVTNVFKDKRTCRIILAPIGKQFFFFKGSKLYSGFKQSLDYYIEDRKAVTGEYVRRVKIELSTIDSGNIIYLAYARCLSFSKKDAAEKQKYLEETNISLLDENGQPQSVTRTYFTNPSMNGINRDLLAIGQSFQMKCYNNSELSFSQNMN